MIELTEENLREIYTLRSVLEGLAIRLVAPKIDEHALRGLSDVVEQMKVAANSGESERVALRDLEFHQQIWKMAGHRRLYNMLNSSMVQTRIFLALNAKAYDDLLDNCLEHSVLLDALRARDGQEAARLMQQHIDEAGEVTIRYFRKIGLARARLSHGSRGGLSGLPGRAGRHLGPSSADL